MSDEVGDLLWSRRTSDILGPIEVEWTVATRFEANRDPVVIGKSHDWDLDPVPA